MRTEAPDHNWRRAFLFFCSQATGITLQRPASADSRLIGVAWTESTSHTEPPQRRTLRSPRFFWCRRQTRRRILPARIASPSSRFSPHLRHWREYNSDLRSRLRTSVGTQTCMILDFANDSRSGSWKKRRGRAQFSDGCCPLSTDESRHPPHMRNSVRTSLRTGHTRALRPPSNQNLGSPPGGRLLTGRMLRQCSRAHT